MATNFVKYSQLINNTTKYAQRMKRLSNRIFNEVAIPTNPRSMKVVKIFSARPLHTDEEIIHYYPRHVETHALMLKLREYGLFRDEHQDFKEEMKRLRELRGKVKVWKRKLNQEQKES
ncbi:28S ribosomal protein S33, mitochondrial [Nymphalis io]|uniref:28S ribosomal protein S33, mitochondrial n=1 Tax=Inachis io TaxID=171585 RepID=UPI00216A551E|nr:28S ribosomal protein S33, mitochondrial [Nymphalis io]XP_050345818.1 28S ribosomal protein S33, mitochondrial [Nymphalis io]